MSGKQAILVSGVIAYGDRTYHPGDLLPVKISQRQVEKGRAEWPESDEIDDLSYRELQELARTRGISATGKRADLVARLSATYGE